MLEKMQQICTISFFLEFAEYCSFTAKILYCGKGRRGGIQICIVLLAAPSDCSNKASEG